MPGEGRGAEGPHSPARAPAGGPGARRGRRGAAVPLRSWPPSRGARAPHRASSAPGPRASVRGPRRRLVRAPLGLGFRLGGQWEGALRPPPASTAHADPPPGGGARCALTVGAPLGSGLGRPELPRRGRARGFSGARSHGEGGRGHRQGGARGAPRAGGGVLIGTATGQRASGPRAGGAHQRGVGRPSTGQAEAGGSPGGRAVGSAWMRGSLGHA